MGDIRDGSGFYRNGKFYWEGNEAEAYEDEQKRKELRERTNGPDPVVDPECNCGAKKDKDFPNIHSTWCKVFYKYNQRSW